MKRKTDSKQLLDEEYNINGSAVVDSTTKKEIAKETCELHHYYYHNMIGNFSAVAIGL